MRIITGFLLLVFFLSSFCSGADDDVMDLLNKHVSYDFSGVPFDQVLQQVSATSGINIVPLHSITSSVSYKSQVYLTVKDMPLEQFIDWLAGVARARYRIFHDGRVYLSQNYEWVEINKFGMLFIDLKDIVNGSQELESFDGGISELTKIITLFDDNYYIRTEQQADMIKLIAHVPKELKDVFVQLIDEYKSNGKALNKYQAVTDRNLKQLEKKLMVVKEINYPYAPLNLQIKRLENDYSVNIGCSNLIFSSQKQLPQISLKLGKVSLKEAIECIIEKTDFKGAELSVPNGIWLTRYISGWTQAVSRRFLWSDNIVIRSYALDKLGLLIPGNILAAQILDKVAQRAWFDPLAGVIYNDRKRSLIVIADIQIQNRVLLALQELAERLQAD